MFDLLQEDARITAHLAGAMSLLRRRPGGAARRRTIAALASYRRTGRFPRNRFNDAPTPTFIDEDGTRCAMAHLLELAGAHVLVDRVARTANLARIRDLETDGELLHWLSILGLTVAEAARIQPSYCASRSDCYCRGSETAFAVVDASLVSNDAGVFLRVDVIHRGGGVKVGELVRTSAGTSPASALALIGGSEDRYAQRLPHAAVSPFRDCRDALSGALALTTSEVINAVGAGCREILAARDPRFDDTFCGGPGSPPMLTDSGVRDGGVVPEAGTLLPAPDTGPATVVTEPASGCSYAPQSAGPLDATLVLAAAICLARRR